MASNIIIQFNSALQSGDFLRLQDSYTPNVEMGFYWGSASGFLPVTGNISSDINNLKNRINTAYNSTNRYTVTSDATSITITDNIGFSEFSEVNNSTGARLDITIVNDSQQIGVNIDNIELIENATNPCDLVDVRITTNEAPFDLLQPVSVTDIQTTTYTISDVQRSINFINVEVKKGNITDLEEIFAPVINSELFKLDVVNTPSGATLSIRWKGVRNPFFDLEYSINGVDYYSSTSFSGLEDGNYTLYIRDSIGCSITIPFEVTEFEPNVYERTSFFEISEQNSNIWIKQEYKDSCNVYSNLTNTLSYEETTQVNNQSFKQLFQKCDGIVTNQYKTNYENVEIKLIDCDGNESLLVSNQISQNINITDVRDVTIEAYEYNESSFVGVTYVSGNTYDSNTLTANGSYYLASSVPSFMNIDDFIQIEGAGWYRVRDIIFYNNIQTLILDVLESDFPISLNQTVKGTSIYNQLDYELYEASYDLSTLNGDYYLTLDATDSEFDTVSYRSEWFNVASMQYNTYLLQYYNSENNETNYSNGIRNKFRIRYQKQFTYIPNDTNEVYLTDTNAVQTDSQYRDYLKLDLMPMPVNMVRKLGLAFSNDRVFINGLSLIKNNELEVERIGESNEYRFSAQFVRSDYAFDVTISDNSIVLPQGQPLQINDNAEGLLFIN
ncbi:hypothetical protein [Tenacibaculum phage JQ]|nr:hypothetical protein [Tenacibaculum phage JQ]